MRTTIRMDDNLLTQAKVFAAKLGISLTELIEEGLRYRMKLQKQSRTKKIKLPTYKGNGLRAKINLSSNTEISDILDQI